MTATLERDINTETFRDVKNAVYKAVWDFVRAKRINQTENPALVDELLRDGEYYFLRAVRDYDPAKGTLVAYVQAKVHYGLLEQAETWGRHNARYRAGTSIRAEVHDRDEFDVNDLLIDLRQDAATVVQLVLDSPGEMWEAVTGLVRKSGKIKLRQATAKNRIASILTGMGWTTTRVKAAFKEISQVLGA